VAARTLGPEDFLLVRLAISRAILRSEAEVSARTLGPEDFLLVRLAISRAILRSEAEVSARRQPLAISVAPELRNRRREVSVALWASGIRLDTRPVGRCPCSLAPRGARWAAGGIHSAT
jgi:hypothetical protein